MRKTSSHQAGSFNIRVFSIFIFFGAAVLGFLPLFAQSGSACLNTPTQVVSDPSGDQNAGQPAQLDIQSVSVGEDYQYTGSPRMVFVLKVANLSTVPANGIWRARWTFTPSAGTATTYYVAMLSDGSSMVTYQYGTQSGSTVSPVGGIEDGSYATDGTITLVVAKSKVGNPAGGTSLVNVNGVTQSNLGGVLFLGVDSTGNGNYTVRAQDPACSPIALPTPTPGPTPVPGAAGKPRFQVYNPPPTNSFQGGEPSLGSNWLTGNAMYVASLTSIRISFDDCSSPAKDTWLNTNIPSATSLDPILFTDHIRAPGDTTPNRTFVSQLTGQDSITFYTDNDGSTYIPSQGGGIPSGVDHQTIGAGPYHAGTIPPHTYPNAVYYCSQDIAASFCARSDDGGLTFGAGVPMYNLTQCTGIHGHVKVAPDGTVYVANRSCGNKAAVVVSKDNGITWAVKPVPTGSSSGFLVDPSVGVGANSVGKPLGQPSNTIYLGYQASDNHAHIAVSHDQGDTWSNDQDVGASLGLVNTTFPEVVAGDDNRASYAFFGTTIPGNYTDPAAYPASAPWHLYVATTFDGGITYTTLDATPTDPVQRGTICNLGTTSCKAHSDAGIPDRNLLDFMDETVDAQGRAMVGYPDGCVGSCIGQTSVTDPKLVTRTALASIARQSGGQRLFAAFDPNPAEPVVPSAPRVDSVFNDGTGVIHVNWSAPDNGGSPITGYNVYRRLSSGSYSAPLATVPGTVTTFDDPITDPNASYFYKVTAINAVNEGPNCGEFPVTAPPPINPCTLPGFLVDADPTGDQTAAPANSDLDIQGVYLAEPYQSDGVARLIFTMKVADLSTIVPNRQWIIVWTPPTPPPTSGSDRYYVAMKSDATGGVGSVTYEYGTVAATGNTTTKLGDVDAGSFNANGVIQIALANSKVGNPGAGATLTTLSGRNFAGTGDGTITKTSAVDSTPDGSYTLVGNNFCRVNNAPIAALTASPTSGFAPLAVSFNASGSNDPDTGAPADTIANYTFDFGDGTAKVTQSNPLISHTYTDSGNFLASVTVTDSRGKVSANAAGVVIQVAAPLSSVGSRKVHGASGTFDIDMPLANAAGLECRAGGTNGDYTLVFTFLNPLTSVGSADVTRGTGSVPGNQGAIGADSHQYLVSVTGVANAQHLEVTLHNVHDSAGAILSAVRARMDVLVGDTTGDGAVNSADISQTKSRSGSVLSGSNFRSDATVDGAINSADISLVKSKSGTGLP